MTFDPGLIQNLDSAECDEATLALFAGRSQPVLDGGVGLRRVWRGGRCGVALPRVPLGGARPRGNRVGLARDESALQSHGIPGANLWILDVCV